MGQGRGQGNYEEADAGVCETSRRNTRDGRKKKEGYWIGNKPNLERSSTSYVSTTIPTLPETEKFYIKKKNLKGCAAKMNSGNTRPPTIVDDSVVDFVIV